MYQNVAVYARVSTDIQAEQGYSIGTQIDACRKKAAELNAANVKEYVDDGYSGAYLDRPALNNLRDAVRARLIDALVCYTPDRLSRNLSHQLILADELKACSVELVFVSGSFADNAEGRLFFQMSGAFAEYEREKIKERTMRGKKAKAQAGKITHDYGIFGYDYDKSSSQFVINPAQAKTVRKMYDLILTGECKSAYAVYYWLDAHADEYPPPSAVWNYVTVAAILRRTHYTGEFFAYTTYTRKQGTKKRVIIKRPKSEWVPSTCPPVVTPEEHAAVQSVITGNRSRAVCHASNEVYLFQGLFRCGRCGRKLKIKGVRGTKYYCCRPQYTVKATRYLCGARYAEVTATDLAVWETIENICKNEKTLAAYIGKTNDRTAEKTAAKLKKTLQKLAANRRQIVAWYSQELLTEQEATAKLKSIKQKEAATEKELAALPADNAAINIVATVDMVKTCGKTPAERREVLTQVIDYIEFERIDAHRTTKEGAYTLSLKIHFRGFGASICGSN